jgi:hypothetical protein
MTRHNISQSIDEQLETIASYFRQDHNICVLYLFGSQVSGRQSLLSDVDFAVLLHPEIAKSERFLKRIELLSKMMTMFGSERVDLVVLNDAPLTLSHKVISSRKILVENNAKMRINFEESIMRKYLDTRILHKYHQQQQKLSIRSGNYFD